MKKALNYFLFCRRFSLSSTSSKKVQPNSKVKGSSYEWLSRQLSDPFVERAKRHNYRCRSAFKLIEIDDKFKIMKPGDTVIDCGASPGSWTQVAVQRVNSDGFKKTEPQGIVVAIDRQLIYPIEGATIFGNSDFTDPNCQERLLNFLNGRTVDSVISDMAPNATGVKVLDTENIIKLCYSALKFALKISNEGGSVLVKLWQCGQTKQLQTDMERFYENVRVVKPSASRADSAEIFLLARGFKGLKTDQKGS
ncbi:rRNA methyltransferase 2, mitochondrial [Anthonomus grandis grandis]|uniref:rRNA methyltransferase 2, mitochondrial n=1 Tax=Anthonomus grandis grandis TaxID=2921223 RepID=UPI002166BE00|nr:rRNA methyltransferase 2, mitochondrial [Anthonomus grandis grandis]